MDMVKCNNFWSRYEFLITRKKILLLGGGQIQELNDTTLTVEKSIQLISLSSERMESRKNAI